MAEVRVAPRRLSLKVNKVNDPCAAASTREPITPNAAASVAVAIPEYIEPMTSMTSNITGMSSFDSLSFWRNVIGASGGGTSCFLNTDHNATYPMNIPASTKPGIMPAMNSLDIDSLMVTP